nr:MAG TPA: hypothetical protein [Caudoviricetes sp.]
MQDLVALGTGNSRLMKSNIPANTTLSQFIQMLNNGTFPYDIGPLNPAGISQEGTPLNKGTLLKDTTAALFGLDVSNVPDDVLAFLGKYNQYWWKRSVASAKYVSKISGANIQVTATGQIDEKGHECIYISYNSSIVISESGKVSLASGSSSKKLSGYQYDSDYYEKSFSALKGKYTSINGNIYYFADDATCSVSGGINEWHFGVRAVTAQKVESVYSDYIFSSDREAYPDSGIQDGYEYQFLGIPFENSVLPLRVETGSYVGTGTYGVNNPCSLTLPFEPKLFIVGDTDGRKGTRGDNLYFALPIFLGDTYEKIQWKFGGSTATQYTLMKREGSTISWYINFTGSGSNQLNGTGTTYYYYAIG